MGWGWLAGVRVVRGGGASLAALSGVFVRPSFGFGSGRAHIQACLARRSQRQVVKIPPYGGDDVGFFGDGDFFIQFHRWMRARPLDPGSPPFRVIDKSPGLRSFPGVMSRTKAPFTLSSLLRGALALGCLWLASCTTIPELGALADKGGTKGRRIKVSLSAQKAYLYHYGKLVAESPVSSGREGKATPLGSFSVVEKDIDHRSSLYGNYVRDGKVVKENVDIRKGGRPSGCRFEGVPMPYFLRFSGACGLHAGKVPGYPASSGCIRLPKRQAKRFYDAVRVGTPVIVVR